ncbi:MAG: TPM domain-containing protein [Bacteroidia bacterium]
MKPLPCWGAGQKGKDNGVLISIFADDRQMRFEVGYGLEPYLTDYETRRIQEDDMIPLIKEGDYFHAIQAGISRSIGQIASTPSSEIALEEEKRTF